MAVLRKLKYCPVCGSYVPFDYSNGAWYSVITWRCRKQRCVMSRDDNFLHEWNEENKRSIAVWLRQIAGAIPWWFYRRWAHWKVWQANRQLKGEWIMEFPKDDRDYPIAKRNRAKDQIGDLLQYARCDCGKSRWYAKKNNPGIYLGGGKGRTMCNECYLKDRERIDTVSRARMQQETWIYPVADGDDLEVMPPFWTWKEHLPSWAIDAGTD